MPLLGSLGQGQKRLGSTLLQPPHKRPTPSMAKSLARPMRPCSSTPPARPCSGPPSRPCSTQPSMRLSPRLAVRPCSTRTPIRSCPRSSARPAVKSTSLRRPSRRPPARSSITPAPRLPNKRSASSISSRPSSGVQKVEFQNFNLPRELCHHLDTWGPKLRETIAAIQTSWVRAKRVQGFRRLDAAGLRIGTGCPGAEAPAWSLR